MRRPATVLFAALGFALVHAGCERAPVAAAPNSAKVAAPPGAPSILLVTLDTTRADHLGCYGMAAAKTPNLDAFAARATRFDDAQSTCPITLPSHASMLTGLYPFRHGVRENSSFCLPPEAETVAERLGAAGYTTAAVVASVVLARATGIAQGFDSFSEPQRGTRPDRFFASIDAEAVNAEVRRWWDGRDRSRPFFLWVHYYDPHAPYTPPPAFAAGAASPYDGEISAVDAAVGALLAMVAPEEQQRRLLTVITADHGEALGFRGEPHHEIHLYEPVLRVPLLIRWPEGAEAGRVRTDLVSGVDVAPTLLAAAGVAAAESERMAVLDGRDLRVAADEPRAVYAESWYPWLAFGWSPVFAFITADTKYVHSTHPELYHRAVGSVEGEDLAATSPDQLARMGKALRLFLQEHGGRGALARARADLGAEKLAQLRAIGYTSVATDTRDLADPFALDPALPVADERRIRRFFLATTPDARVPVAQQVALLQKIVAEEPRNVAAWDALARVFLDSRQPDLALEPLRRLLALAPANADAWANLGAAHQQRRELDAAIRCYRQALELDPHAPAPLVNLANCLDATGAKQEAAELRARLAAQEKAGAADAAKAANTANGK